ncbi:hypothetical protein T09_6553 [Trichinella sp. T9]|nr:hypothetical protein T09_6553 [Trichinella sp. T9]
MQFMYKYSLMKNAPMTASRNLHILQLHCNKYRIRTRQKMRSLTRNRNWKILLLISAILHHERRLFSNDQFFHLC